MITRFITSVILALGLTWLFVSPSLAAHEAAACGPYDQFTEQLEQKYNEVPTAYGLIEDKSVMQLYASSESGTWTILVTNRQGVSCIVAAGHSWERFELNMIGPGA